jgi:preprotein translocase subunit SecY
MWLAIMISRHGLGSGVWLLLAAPHLADLPRLVVGMLELYRTGVMPAAGAITFLAYVVAAVMALVALGLTVQRVGRPLDRTLIWPLFIGPLPAEALLVVPWMLPDGPTRYDLADLLSPGTPVHLAFVAAFVVIVALVQWRRTEPRSAQAEASTPAKGDGESPTLLSALALAAIAVVPSFLAACWNVPVLIGGRWIAVLVAVALPITGLLRREPG